MQVTDKMREAACLVITERGKGNNVTIADINAMIAAALDADIEPVAWWWEDATGFHITLDRSDVVAMAAVVGCEPKPLYAARFFDKEVTGDPLELPYKNWRGEISTRKIQPIRIEFGATEWHPEPQWLLVAIDIEKNAERSFALKDFNPPLPTPSDAAKAIKDIFNERQRQMNAEGWTLKHDDQHTGGTLALAAGAYCESAARPDILSRKSGAAFAIPKLWPGSWSLNWWKPKSPRADLVRAGALIVAEIERIDRAAEYSTKQGDAV